MLELAQLPEFNGVFYGVELGWSLVSVNCQISGGKMISTAHPTDNPDE